MIIGVPKEIKNNEYRVGMTPAGVHALKLEGHRILVEKGAGLGSGIDDSEYQLAGAEMLDDHASIFSGSDMIVKVKEPIESEYSLFKHHQTLFTYLHLAPNPSLTKMLLEKSITGIAYETVQLPNGFLPLLAPMSEVAGRMSVQIGAYFLQKSNGGMGVLLGGVPGVLPAHVLIIGGGVVGTNAARMALGLGARVTVADINRSRLTYLDDTFGGRISTVIYNPYHIAELVKETDLLIGAVLVAGAKAPKTVSEEMVKTMKKGSVIVDVAIDQGGSIETIDRITTHDDPKYVKHGVVHYSVANMPGAAPRTSTFALTGVTLPYILQLAGGDPLKVLKENHALMQGLNTYNGHITCKAVAEAMDMPYLACDTIAS